MSIRIIISFLVAISSILTSYSQNKTPYKIQYLDLKDKFVIKEIEKLIKDEINSNDTSQFFKKGLGYIKLNIYNYSDRDTIIKYYLTPSLEGLKKEDTDNKYPLFYTYVSKRIVLIYLNVLLEFADYKLAEKSKRRIRKKIEPFLEKTRKMTFYDIEGKKTFTDKNFRIDYIKFHAGRYIYILKDKPPIVINENF